MPGLLAVDLGLRTGLAYFSADGRLQWYRSQNFGTTARLKRGAYGLLKGLTDEVSVVLLEGGGTLETAWTRTAERFGLRVHAIQAGTWRKTLLHARQRRSGADAKQHADDLARRIIDWSGAARPTSLRHDAAEAICIGLWGVLQLGWLDDLPPELR